MKRILALEAQTPTTQPEILAPNRKQQEPESPAVRLAEEDRISREVPDVGAKSNWLVVASALESAWRRTQALQQQGSAAAKMEERCPNRKQVQTITMQRQPITSRQLHAKDELHPSIWIENSPLPPEKGFAHTIT